MRTRPFAKLLQAIDLFFLVRCRHDSIAVSGITVNALEPLTKRLTLRLLKTMKIRTNTERYTYLTAPGFSMFVYHTTEGLNKRVGNQGCYMRVAFQDASYIWIVRRCSR